MQPARRSNEERREHSIQQVLSAALQLFVSKGYENATIDTIAAKAGDGGRLFGSVSAADIVAAVDEQAGVTIDARALDLDAAIKDVGEHMVMTTLHADVAFPITVSVIEE